MEIWWVNGWVHSRLNTDQLLATLEDPAVKSWIRNPRYILMVANVFAHIPPDRDIEYVNLESATVDEAWFIRLNRLPRLAALYVRGDQRGPGLSHLQDNPAWKHLVVTGATAGQLAELNRLPQLEHVTLDAPLSLDAGLEHLATLPRLNALTFYGVTRLNEHLELMPELPHVEFLNFYECAGLADGDLVHLQKLPRVNYVNLWKSGTIGDEGLALLAELHRLEHLHFHRSNGTITDDGLKSLGRLRLKELSITGGTLTPAQQTTLQKLLPGTAMFLR